MVILDKGAVKVFEMHPLRPPAKAVAKVSPRNPEVDEYDELDI
jgi:hypothetical protein